MATTTLPEPTTAPTDLPDDPDAPEIAPPALPDVALDYYEYLRLKEQSANTIRLKRVCIKALSEHLSGHLGRMPDASDYNGPNLFRFFADVVTVRANKSYMSYRSWAKDFGDWLMKTGLIPWGPHPIDAVPRRKERKTAKRTRWLADEEFIRLAAAAKRSHQRDYFLVWFLWLTGRRIGEVLAMTWADVAWEEGVIYYDNTKGRKYGRRIVLTAELELLLQSWEQFYVHDIGRDVHEKDFLFPACVGMSKVKKGRKRPRRLNPTKSIRNAAETSKKLLMAAGLYHAKGDGWHVLRKNFLNNIKKIARAAGHGDGMEMAKIAADHEDIRTTGIYINWDEEFERFYEFMRQHGTELVSDALAEATPFLRDVVAARKAAAEEPEPEEPMQEAASSASVVSLDSRRRLAVVR